VWVNGGKMGLDIGQYKSVQKDSLFYLIGDPFNSPGDLILDFKNNRVEIFDHTLISEKINPRSPAFFIEDTLYYSREDNSISKALAFRDVFVNKISQDRLFLNEITLFWNITYLGIAGVFLFLLAYGSVLWQRRKLPRLVKGGIRHSLTFYPLSNEEQKVLNFLRQNLSASTKELIPIFSKHNRSFSQTHKLKADAIDNINKLLNTLVGKDLIKKKKDSKDKRQFVYYYKRNILH
jgi:DNA-binding MarR family transcriptional regulator